MRLDLRPCSRRPRRWHRPRHGIRRYSRGLGLPALRRWQGPVRGSRGVIPDLPHTAMRAYPFDGYALFCAVRKAAENGDRAVRAEKWNGCGETDGRAGKQLRATAAGNSVRETAAENGGGNQARKTAAGNSRPQRLRSHDVPYPMCCHKKTGRPAAWGIPLNSDCEDDASSGRRTAPHRPHQLMLGR